MRETYYWSIMIYWQLAVKNLTKQGQLSLHFLWTFIYLQLVSFVSFIITRGTSGPTSLKMGSFRRRVAILQTITSSPTGFAKRA